tara:strand:+ start:1418 stop:1717 length:300 start_codon:yes stop_codon:yes gene_type:complete
MKKKPDGRKLKALDRDFFKYRETGVKEKKFLECCGGDPDHHTLNKNNDADWELILEHCQRVLNDYPSTETIVPVCCKTCGRLLRYSSTVNNKAYYGKDK